VVLAYNDPPHGLPGPGDDRAWFAVLAERGPEFCSTSPSRSHLRAVPRLRNRSRCSSPSASIPVWVSFEASFLASIAMAAYLLWARPKLRLEVRSSGVTAGSMPPVPFTTVPHVLAESVKIDLWIPGRREVMRIHKERGGPVAAVFPFIILRALRSFGILPVEAWGRPGSTPPRRRAPQAYTCNIVRNGLSFPPLRRPR
jgi:hypothetical protein